MGALSTTSRFPDPDAAYRMIVEAHRGLDDEAAATFSAALVLVLANHIGDPAVLKQAIDIVRASLQPRPAAPSSTDAARSAP